MFASKIQQAATLCELHNVAAYFFLKSDKMNKMC